MTSQDNIVEETVTAARPESAEMQNRVFVLDTNRQLLAPCHPARARELLRKGKAAVYRRYPFTIILKRAVEADPAPVQLKVDPGSKTTGMVLVQEGRVVFAAELAHRGQAIKNALEKRCAVRRGLRSRKTRYRQPRFLNRTRPQGWLAPSLKSRVDNLQTWFTRFIKLCNVQAISMELVRFDTQLMQNAEISGVEYQQGELAGYEVREYLLEKWGRQCSYCGAKDCPLEIEHITPKSRGGSNRVSNLCLACNGCNQAKGNATAAEFGHAAVQAQAKRPLKDAAALNATRWAIWRMFDATGLRVEVGTGGRTKSNRTRQNYPKAHWIDAACVGQSGAQVRLCAEQQPLHIKAMGRGQRQMVSVDAFGFPRGKPKQAKRVHGFQTGDRVRALVPKGKYAGKHSGRVAVRMKGTFKVGNVDGINWRHCRLTQRIDGYDYSQDCPVGQSPIPLPDESGSIPEV
jgi:5-methylcytosine-specific restriction endonuclease McrA